MKAENLIARGTLAARPAPGVPGRLYYVTDAGADALYRDTGAAWEVYQRGAKPVISLSFGADEVPEATGAVAPVLRVPFGPGGASLTFTLTRLTLRREAVGGATSTVTVERSPGGGAFATTAVGSVSALAADYEETATAGLGTLTSGQLVRVNWTALGGAGGAGSGAWTVTVEGEVA